jgi:ribonuclease VapC
VIAVDTSALMAIVLDEAEADCCAAALEAEREVLISAGTVAETLIVATRRNVAAEAARLIGGLGLTVVPITSATAQRMAKAHQRWGKGMHRAGLNFGDCMSYAVAEEHSCPLLFVGDDFSKTDLKSVL